MFEAMPNSANEVDHARFMAAAKAHNDGVGEMITKGKMLIDIKEMYERCYPLVEEQKKTLQRLGYVRHSKPGTGPLDEIIDYVHAKDKTMPTLTLNTLRIKIDKRKSGILCHDGMVKQTDDFIKSLLAPKQGPLPGLGGTPLTAPKAGPVLGPFTGAVSNTKTGGKTMPPAKNPKGPKPPKND
jgi:hypothetical protein